MRAVWTQIHCLEHSTEPANPALVELMIWIFANHLPELVLENRGVGVFRLGGGEGDGVVVLLRAELRRRLGVQRPAQSLLALLHAEVRGQERCLRHIPCCRPHPHLRLRRRRFQ